MENTLLQCSELTEHRGHVKCEVDGAGGTGRVGTKRGGASNGFGKRGKSFDPDSILLSKKPELTVKDVECPICWAILYEPTTLPCNHSLCTACFLQHAEETSLYCPCCRKRLSIWSRKAKKRNELLDNELWARLKNEFSAQIAARENDDSEDALPCELLSQPSVRDGVISETPGAIFDELKQVIKPHEEDLEKQRREAEAASIQLIQKLQEEEMKKFEAHKKIEVEDFHLARRLQEGYQSNFGNGNKSRKSNRARTPCRLLNDFDYSFDHDVRRKSRPAKKFLSSRKEETVKIEPGESAQIRVDSTGAAATANDDLHVQGASVKPEQMDTEIIDNHDRAATSAAVTDICLLQQQPGPSVDAMKTENDNHAEPSTSVQSTSLRLLEQPAVSLKREKGETEVDKNNQQSTITVINVNVELTEMLQDIIQQMETQEESIKVVEPDPKSEERKSGTILGNIPTSPFQLWTSKGFDLSGLSSDDEIIPPSDCEDDGEDRLRPSCSSGLSFCFDEIDTAAGSDDDDRMSSIIDYEVEEAEAAAWDAYRKKLEQEAEDRAYALTLQRDINLGIDSNRSRSKESENKYGLRTWTRSRKT